MVHDMNKLFTIGQFAKLHEINKKTLNFIKKDKIWLKEELAKKNLEIQNIFYAFYKNKKIYLIKKSDV